MTTGQQIVDRAKPGLCECGCGEQPNLALETRPDRGWVKGEPMRFVWGHQARGNQHRLGQRLTGDSLERMRAGVTTHGEGHGESRSPEYVSWQHAKDRCFNPNNHAWNRYGGRGITMCARWSRSFEQFLADMGRRPSPLHTLDRIDNDRGYEPSNCRWATKKTQTANRGGR
jgi:hypothetical protein